MTRLFLYCLILSLVAFVFYQGGIVSGYRDGVREGAEYGVEVERAKWTESGCQMGQTEYLWL